MAARAPDEDDDPFASLENLFRSSSGARSAVQPTRDPVPVAKADTNGASGAVRAPASERDRSQAASASVPAPPDAAPGAGTAQEAPGGGRPWWAIAVATLAVLAGGLAWALLGSGARDDGPAPPAGQPQGQTALPVQDPTAPSADSPAAPSAQDPTATPAQTRAGTPTAAAPQTAGSAPSASPTTRTAAPAAGPFFATADQLELSGGAILATNHRGFTGGGFVTGLDHEGAAVGWRVTAPAAGYYRLTVRYSNALGVDQLEIERNLGVWANSRSFGQLRMPVIGSWDSWGTTWRQIRLVKGQNRIMISCGPEDSCHVNLDTLRLARLSSAQ